MAQELSELTKKEIKSIFKGNREGDSRIDQIAALFNIPIDKSRIEDYVITKVDENIPSIEMIDSKNNISYASCYTSEAKMLNFHGSFQFNHLTITSPERKIESLFYIGKSNPIISRMTVKNGSYKLVFEKERTHGIGFGNKGDKMVVRYCKTIQEEGTRKTYRLWNKIYIRKQFKGRMVEEFEQEYTDPPKYIKYDDSQDKYTYIEPSGVIYGINRLKQKEVCSSFCGICVENGMNLEARSFPIRFDLKYFPHNLYLKDYPILTESCCSSFMLFQGRTSDQVYHTLQVYKKDRSILVAYQAEKIKEVEKKIEYALSTMTDGTISNREIQNIIHSFPTKIGESLFVLLVEKELNQFGTKLDIQKGLAKEVIDPLSPKVLMDQSFDEIGSRLSSQKEEYFRLGQVQFDQYIHKENDLEKSKTKILKSIHS